MKQLKNIHKMHADTMNSAVYTRIIDIEVYEQFKHLQRHETPLRSFDSVDRWL